MEIPYINIYECYMFYYFVYYLNSSKNKNNLYTQITLKYVKFWLLETLSKILLQKCTVFQLFCLAPVSY